ncbi:MAG TPA: hypothetical protein DIC18_03585 [Clostridiales bacterium]|nr:hypothetical protein [Clostridiales bacterium]HCU56396.1 hypothetical protein [Clostridiales bacterium]
MEKEFSKKPHSLIIKGDTTVSGVTQVIALEEKEVKVAIGDKTLLLAGDRFNAEKLSLEEGVLVLSGEVSTVKYLAKQEAKSLLKRIFK